MDTSSDDVHAEVDRDTSQPVRVALAHRSELPVAAVAVELTEVHGRFGRGVLTEVVTRQLVPVAVVDDANVGVPYLTERLVPVVRLMNGDSEDNPIDLQGNGRQIHPDLLIVAGGPAFQVVAGVRDRAVRTAKIAVEDEVPVRQHLAVGADA